MRRILSIDGGGVKGVYAAQFLAMLEEDIDGSISEYFDLIAGTSTGGIIAIGLAMGVPAQDILDMYEQHAKHIFGQTGSTKFVRRMQRTARMAKYIFWGNTLHADSLYRALKSVLGEHTLGEAKTRLFIPALSAEKGYPRIYKTRHHNDYIIDHKLPAVEVAMATAAPPTFTAPWKVNGKDLMVDGGLWANNPASSVVVEAITKLNWPPDEISLLSIGSCPDARAVRRNYSAIRFAMQGTQICLHAQARASDNMARLLLGGGNAVSRIIRVSEAEDSNAPSMDNVDNIDSLKNRACSKYTPESKQIKDHFCRTKANPFVPVPAEEY